MSSPQRAFRSLFLLGFLAAAPGLLEVRGAFAPEGQQFSLSGSLAGDQVGAQAAFRASGGYVVWQDNGVDGDGLGISARRLSSLLSGSLDSFRVNAHGAGDQSAPQVAMLNDGGAVVVWEGGPAGINDVFARFVRPDGTFATGDVAVNTTTKDHQTSPVVAVLEDGSVAVVWASYGQDGDLYGVFGRRFSAAGAPLGGEFGINQTVSNNQRNPSVAALRGGGFVVVWLSERSAGTVYNRDQTGAPQGVGYGAALFRVDLMGAIFDAAGALVVEETRLNSKALSAANPSVTPLATGGFSVAWSAWNEVEAVLVGNQKFTRGWDIFSRSFDSKGVGLAEEVVVNQTTFGDQFGPRVAASDSGTLVVWSSLGQEGFQQGVYARFLQPDGAAIGGEFRVNTTTAGPQLYPSLAGDGQGRFLVAWSVTTGGVRSFDVAGQRYTMGTGLLPAPAPMVSGLSQSRLSVTWPDPAGLAVESYELYVDGASVPITLTGNHKELGELAPGSSHSVQLVYRLVDGRRSPLSAAGTGRTWGEDENLDGLPDDWQRLFWGASRAVWPGPGADSDGDGASTAAEFLAGTSPVDAASVLSTQIVGGTQGGRLQWNSQPGLVYQVETSLDLASWTKLGSARFSHGSSDSIAVTNDGRSSYYRVVRVR